MLKGGIGRAEVADPFIDPPFQLLARLAGKNHRGKADDLAAVPLKRFDHHSRLNAAAVLSDQPPLLGGKARKRAADDLGRLMADEARGSGGAAENLAGRIEHENRAIGAAAPH